MAADTTLRLRYPSGATLYTQIESGAGVWNGTGFVAFAVADWSTYATSTPETPAASGRYVCQFPTSSPAGNYTWSVYLRSGASPASTDVCIGSGNGYWDGATFGGSASSAGGSDLAISGSVNDPDPQPYAFRGASTLSTVDNFYSSNGLALCFTSGALSGLKATIAGYEGASRKFSFLAPFPIAPADGDTFVIL